MNHIHVGAVHVLAVQHNLSFNPNSRNQVIHPVQRPQKSGLTTARSAYDGNEFLVLYGKIKVFYDKRSTRVGKIEMFNPDDVVRRLCILLTHFLLL